MSLPKLSELGLLEEFQEWRSEQVDFREVMRCAWCGCKVNSLRHLRGHNRRTHWPQKPPAVLGVPEGRCPRCFKFYPSNDAEVIKRHKEVDCRPPTHCGQPLKSILVFAHSKVWSGNDVVAWRLLCSVTGKLATTMCNGVGSDT